MRSNVEILRESFAAFARGDINSAMANFAEELDWREAEHHPYADRNPYRKPQEVLEGIFGRVAQDFSEYALDVKEMLDCGDTVVVTGRYKGVSRATGRRLDAQFAYLIRMRAGKLVSFQQYTDTAQWQEVLG